MQTDMDYLLDELRKRIECVDLPAAELNGTPLHASTIIKNMSWELNYANKNADEAANPESSCWTSTNNNQHSLHFAKK
jgi:hypothetical protein